ncbi:hypothetical protein YC2023_087008 [Brassica napus]
MQANLSLQNSRGSSVVIIMDFELIGFSSFSICIIYFIPRDIYSIYYFRLVLLILYVLFQIDDLYIQSKGSL